MDLKFARCQLHALSPSGVYKPLILLYVHTSLVQLLRVLLHSDLFLISRCLECPFVEVSVHIAVIATKNRVENLVRYVEGINERDCLFPDGLE